MTAKIPQTSSPLRDSAPPTFRSGAVARMAGMPVATLRIWEQRYQAVRPTTAASGHRLYSAGDVERVTLLRRLTEQGHAIGQLAALDMAHMRELMHASKDAGSTNGGDAPAQPMRIVVVGQALAHRLQRWDARQPGGRALQCVGVFDSLADATQAAKRSSAPGVDLLLWQAASLQPGNGHELRVAQDAWRAQSAAVVYRYSSAAGRAELTGAGAVVFLEPADDEALGQWLVSLQRSDSPRKATEAPDGSHPGATDLADHFVTAPRFADLALTEFAEFSSALACECPSHLAQLLLQISNFETYSGDCAHRNEADAQLHVYLQRVAGAARMLFETALEQVAIAEGLPLPHPPARA
jgi:DNA-binding transcriptional MerR regulator